MIKTQCNDIPVLTPANDGVEESRMPGQGRHGRDVDIVFLRLPRGGGEHKDNTVFAGAGEVLTIGRERHDRDGGGMSVEDRLLRILVNDHRFSVRVSLRREARKGDFDSASCTTHGFIGFSGNVGFT